MSKAAKSPQKVFKVIKAADQQSQIKKLIAFGKEKGFLTYAEVSDHLVDLSDAEQIDDVIVMIQGMGIQVHDEAPDTETQLFTEPTVVAGEDDVDAVKRADGNWVRIAVSADTPAPVAQAADVAAAAAPAAVGLTLKATLLKPTRRTTSN